MGSSLMKLQCGGYCCEHVPATLDPNSYRGGAYVVILTFEQLKRAQMWGALCEPCARQWHTLHIQNWLETFDVAAHEFGMWESQFAEDAATAVYSQCQTL